MSARGFERSRRKSFTDRTTRFPGANLLDRGHFPRPPYSLTSRHERQGRVLTRAARSASAADRVSQCPNMQHSAPSTTGRRTQKRRVYEGVTRALQYVDRPLRAPGILSRRVGGGRTSDPRGAYAMSERVYARIGSLGLRHGYRADRASDSDGRPPRLLHGYVSDEERSILPRGPGRISVDSRSGRLPRSEAMPAGRRW